MTFSGESMGAPSVAETAKSTGDSEEKSVLVFGDQPDSSQVVTEMAVDSEDEPNCHHVVTEMSLDADDDTRTLAPLGGHVKPAAKPAAGSQQVDSDEDDNRTLASQQHVKPAAKPSYKYKYNSFMNDCTKLATAVQNRPQVAEAVHGTILTLTRIAQGQESQIDKKTFSEIIEGAQAAFGAKRLIHSGISFSQVGGQQGLPISANPGALGRPLKTRKRSYTEGMAPVKGSDEKADCGFCGQKGHNIVSCANLKMYGKRIRGEEEFRQLADDLLIADGHFAATPIPNQLMTNSQQILQSLPTETKFLVVQGKYIINNELVGPVRSQNLCILVTCIGAAGQPIPECNQVLAQASIVNGWMNKSKKKYKFVISSLTRDMYLQKHTGQHKPNPVL